MTAPSTGYSLVRGLHLREIPANLLLLHPALTPGVNSGTCALAAKTAGRGTLLLGDYCPLSSVLVKHCGVCLSAAQRLPTIIACNRTKPRRAGGIITRVPQTERYHRPTGLAFFLIIAGIIAFAAAFALTLDKIHLLEDPTAQLSCSFSVLIGCATNLSSPQGAVFGFPNPLIGLAAWSVVITIGVAILAGARFARWFWVGFNVGVLGAMIFVIWLIGQSIFVLDVLCPWCMATWAVTIPVFLAVTLYNFKVGNLPGGASVRRAAAGAYSWMFVITIVCYIVFFIVAQVNMDVLNRL
ncbi:vitamin K epoxide reductase family protein [Cryobacterium sp. Hh11]|nr:vitamin K epoxide reductase family protein [Cryobacterium sp. Hh11]